MISSLLTLLIATAAAESSERIVVRSERAAVVEMRTAALIMSGQQGGDLPIAVAALPGAGPRGDAGKDRAGIRDSAITVLVEIDGAALLANPAMAGDRGPTVEVFAYVLGTELDVLAQTSLSLAVDPSRHRQALAANGLKVFLPLEVPPGDHLLRLLAQAGESFGLRSLKLPAGMAPVFHEPARPWLVAAPAGLGIELPPPFGLDSGSPLPATRPAFVEARAAPAPTGSRPAQGSAASEEATGRRRSPPTRAQRRLARDAGDAYARALRQLAAGERRSALATLRASEERVVEVLDADAVGLLAQAEAQVLEPLSAADWGCLLPAILLHLDLSLAYRDSGQPILAHHATRMMLALAGDYARKLETPQAAAEAARAVSSLGGYLQSTGARSRAEKLFTQALDLAGDDAAGLLGLATSFEKRGLTARAIPVFENFAAARPEHAGGALRLALNRARAGEVAAAKRALDRLTAQRRNDWVALLAHQELARLLVDETRLADATGVLRRGLERWAGHPTLTIQLAWVLDAQGEIEASSDLIEDLRADAEARPADERSRYNRFPEDVLAASRRALIETASARLEDLGRWLSSRDPSDGPVDK